MGDTTTHTTENPYYAVVITFPAPFWQEGFRQPPPKGPDAREAKAQEAADMKKKVTDLSQALAVGLPVPASAAGETFSDVPAPPWAVPAAPEWKNGGKAAPSDPYLVPPL